MAIREGLSSLIHKYGGKRVMTLVRNLAHLAGEEV
jgi:hypothetical protein